MDPAAFRSALLADPERIAALQSYPEYLGAEKARMARMAERWAERTVDAQRASAPVPRDTVHVYKQLAEAGLEYGPAFRLLRNVHVPLPDN
ncbi:hypothetical protein GPECTOR_17g887 [Gonium pectorale]|uniref:Polyketide synthase dehydratase domain-containing protein n=1 Tax=Gonium pectorale TaxID=33097 RepID=A0A150GK79_GONPE|nr:hypothetical protein GPECTOR_17g887 [Gonium pectorale]|eukprot:KXZ50249.1 hypothetical protein GPECTOR_17g887 [Gonium pectorale]